MSKSKQNIIIKVIHRHVRVLLLLIAIVSVVSTLLVIHASPSSTPPTSLFNSIPTTEALNPNNIEQTADWKVNSVTRKTLNFTIKSPAQWEQAFDHCDIAPEANGFNLAPSCVKIVVFTDRIPAEGESGNGRKLKLVSKTKATVQGYTVLRKIYADQSNDVTPDTYQVWFYDNNRPFMLVLAWIGVGTDAQTANEFVHKLDSMVSTLQLQKK